MRRRGFTLIEMVVVVAIIAIIAALGLAGMSRHNDKTRVHKAARDLAQKIAGARAIAEIVGPRIRTPLLITNGCPVPNEITVTIDPGGNSYTVAERVEYNAGTDTITVFCKQYDVGVNPLLSETHGLGRLETPAGTFTLSFSPTGRILRPAVPDDTELNWYFRMARNGTNERYGFRILASGIVCPSTFTAAVACNDDRNL